jgi:hypothetical protein
MDIQMVTQKNILILVLISFSFQSYSFQKSDTLTYNHKEITFETSYLKDNDVNSGSYSAAFSYLFKLNKRLELGPQLYIASYNINELGRFYPLSLRGHIKFYFGDLLKKDSKWINQLYATSKFGLAYELQDENFINSDQYILGLGTSVIYFKNKKSMNLEIGASEVAFKRNSEKFFQNLFTIGLNYKL